MIVLYRISPYTVCMGTNYTPIDDLIKKLTEPISASNSFGKEAEPPLKKREAIGIAVETSKVHEVVEHEHEADMQPFIQAHKETISVPNDLKKIGVQATAAPVFSTLKEVHLPIADETVYHGLKAPLSSSLRWLSEFCIFLLKHAHVTLKELHGKVERVSSNDKK